MKNNSFDIADDTNKILHNLAWKVKLMRINFGKKLYITIFFKGEQEEAQTTTCRLLNTIDK